MPTKFNHLTCDCEIPKGPKEAYWFKLTLDHDAMPLYTSAPRRIIPSRKIYRNAININRIWPVNVGPNTLIHNKLADARWDAVYQVFRKNDIPFKQDSFLIAVMYYHESVPDGEVFWVLVYPG